MSLISTGVRFNSMRFVVACGLLVYFVVFTVILHKKQPTFQDLRDQFVPAGCEDKALIEELQEENRLLKQEIQELQGHSPVTGVRVSSNTTSLRPEPHPLGRFAHVYFIAGFYPERPFHRNYIYDVLVSTYIARQDGSRAEVIVFIQMNSNTKQDELPVEDKKMLDALGIQVRYIPKTKTESFYRTMLDKFRIFNLTEYDRVLLMDSDVMLRQSMDYLFEMSMNGTFRENLLIQGKKEPANGGFFMVKPEKDDWHNLLEIIYQKEQRGLTLPYPHWNTTIGWGHEIQHPDAWTTTGGETKRKWDFLGSFADQGLLWHYIRYVKQSFTYFRKTDIINASPGDSIHKVKEHRLRYWVFNGIDRGFECPIQVGNCRPPRSGYVHFSGAKKPWFQQWPKNLTGDVNKNPQLEFFQALKALDDMYGLNVNYEKWGKKDGKKDGKALGTFPNPKHIKTQYVDLDEKTGQYTVVH